MSAHAIQAGHVRLKRAYEPASPRMAFGYWSIGCGRADCAKRTLPLIVG